MILEAHNVSLQIQKTKVLNGISLHVDAGEMLMILGANGAGKSSFVKTLVGIHKPTAGYVKLNSQRLGYVPQRSINITGLTVLELMQYFATLKRCEENEVTRVLEFIGLDEYQDHYVRQLSGGYRRKLTLAQALLGKPELLILDEPFAGLDQHAVHSLVSLINHFLESGGTVIITTHVFHQPFPVKTRVGVLRKGNLVALDAFENICSQVRLRILRRPGPPISTLLPDLLQGIHIIEQDAWVDLICPKNERIRILNQLEKQQILLDWTEEHLWEHHDETIMVDLLVK